MTLEVLTVTDARQKSKNNVIEYKRFQNISRNEIRIAKKMDVRKMQKY